MTIRRSRKRRPPRPVPDNPGRKQRQARNARQKAKAHAQRIVSDRGTSVVETLSDAGADVAGGQAAQQAGTQVRSRNTGLGHSAPRGVPSRSMIWTGPGRVLATLVLPGSIFAEMGRPAASLVCYALQASLVGWLPAVVWAASARRHVAQKQKQLAARLR